MSAAGPGNVLPGQRRPRFGARRCGCRGSTCRSPPARTNGSCTRPRTSRRPASASCRPRRARVGRHHHGRAAPDPEPALHEDQPASFAPTFRRAQHPPRAPAVLRLGDAARIVGRRTRAVRRHDEVLVVRRIQRHVVDETIVRVGFVLACRPERPTSCIRRPSSSTGSGRRNPTRRRARRGRRDRLACSTALRRRRRRTSRCRPRCRAPCSPASRSRRSHPSARSRRSRRPFQATPCADRTDRR